MQTEFRKKISCNIEKCGEPDLNRRTPSRIDLESIAVGRAWLSPPCLHWHFLSSTLHMFLSRLFNILEPRRHASRDVQACHSIMSGENPVVTNYPLLLTGVCINERAVLALFALELQCGMADIEFLKACLDLPFHRLDPVH